jgi:hypothetical protein
MIFSPVASLSHWQKATASYQDTATTGCSAPFQFASVQQRGCVQFSFRLRHPHPCLRPPAFCAVTARVDELCILRIGHRIFRKPVALCRNRQRDISIIRGHRPASAGGVRPRRTAQEEVGAAGFCRYPIRFGFRFCHAALDFSALGGSWAR